MISSHLNTVIDTAVANDAVKVAGNSTSLSFGNNNRILPTDTIHSRSQVDHQDREPIQKKSRVGVERWSKEEEDKLLQNVSIIGRKNWDDIVPLMGSERSAKAYYHKYCDILRRGDTSTTTSSAMATVPLNLSATVQTNVADSVAAADGELYAAAEDSADRYSAETCAEACTTLGYGIVPVNLNSASPQRQPQQVDSIRSSFAPSIVVSAGSVASDTPASSTPVDGRGKNNLWSAEEDRDLMSFVEEHVDAAHVPWSRIVVNTRTRKAICNRWDYLMKNSLVPRDLLVRYLSNRVVSSALHMSMSPVLVQMGISPSIMQERIPGVAVAVGAGTTSGVSACSHGYNTTSQTCQTDDFALIEPQQQQQEYHDQSCGDEIPLDFGFETYAA